MAKVIDVYSKAVNEGKEAGVYSSDIRVLLAFDLGFATEIEVLLHKDDEMDEKIAAIDAKQEKIAALREELAGMRSIVVCPHCGKTCSREDAFCSGCGGAL